MTISVDLQIAERKLNNGLTLLAVQNTAAPTFACSVSLEADRRCEVKGEAGLAYLTGSSLEEGNKKRDAVQLAAAIDGIGGSLEGSPSGGVVLCPIESKKKAVGLLRDLVSEPTFPARAVARVREEILAEIQEGEDDPRTVARQRYDKAVYGRHPYGRPMRGKKSMLQAFKPADLRRFHKQWFVLQDGYVAASGPDEAEVTLDLLASMFRSWRGKPVEKPQHEAPKLAAERTDTHLKMAREQVHIFLGHAGIRRTDPDFYALQVMDHVLGTGPGFTSRISKKLRDEQGLCYSVNAAITSSAGEEPGTFTAYIGTSPEHRQKAIDGFLREMRRIRREPVTRQELVDVQDYLTGSFVLGLERNTSLAGFAIRCKRFDLGFDFLMRYPELIRAVTVEDVQRVAKKHLHPNRVTIVSAGAG